MKGPTSTFDISCSIFCGSINSILNDIQGYRVVQGKRRVRGWYKGDTKVGG
jgi:hypothetical protein